MENEDDLIGQARFLVDTENKLGVSTLQRGLMIGYNRARRLMDALIDEGLVEPYEAESGIAYRRVTSNDKVTGSP